MRSRLLCVDLLCIFRNNKYLDMCYKGKVEPERMPPTEKAAFYHGLRAHWQIATWKLLNDDVGCSLKPEDWGWKLQDARMTPIKSDLPVAPERLIHIIRCNCKVTSKAPCLTVSCSFRKHGLSCISSCRGCHGEMCENAEVSLRSEC